MFLKLNEPHNSPNWNYINGILLRRHNQRTVETLLRMSAPSSGLAVPVRGPQITHADSMKVRGAHTSGPPHLQTGEHGYGRHGHASCEESCETVTFRCSGIVWRLARR
jgi:hypothetical protein